MNYEVTMVDGAVLTFETELEMVAFVAAYAAEHHRLPKSVRRGGWWATTLQMLVYAEMKHLVKTMNGDMYCLNDEGYYKFIALVAVGARKAPVQSISLVYREFDRPTPYASTRCFEREVKKYVQMIFDMLDPEQKESHIERLLKK